MLKQVIEINGFKEPFPLLLFPGKYLFELYGASGGGSQPGLGGFASGIFVLDHILQVYLLTGGEGSFIEGAGCIEGGWNGGGKVCTQKAGSSGGGSSDIRTDIDNIKSRIIVAGGGGGSGDGQTKKTYDCQGGDGGGYNGSTAVGYSSHFKDEYIYANGGTQDSPGTSFIYQLEGYTKNTNGIEEKGGEGAGGFYYGGGGGGGYFGGGGGWDVTGGGGGSSFISDILFNPKTESGLNKGNGRIIISLLGIFAQCKSLFPLRFQLFSYILIIIS